MINTFSPSFYLCHMAAHKKLNKLVVMRLIQKKGKSAIKSTFKTCKMTLRWRRYPVPVPSGTSGGWPEMPLPLSKVPVVASYSKIVYYIEPNPTLISMTVKSGTSMALRLSLCLYISTSFQF